MVLRQKTAPTRLFLGQALSTTSRRTSIWIRERYLVLILFVPYCSADILVLIQVFACNQRNVNFSLTTGSWWKYIRIEILSCCVHSSLLIGYLLERRAPHLHARTFAFILYKLLTSCTGYKDSLWWTIGRERRIGRNRDVAGKSSKAPLREIQKSTKQRVICGVESALFLINMKHQNRLGREDPRLEQRTRKMWVGARREWTVSHE